jgi:hypothetical protein
MSSYLAAALGCNWLSATGTNILKNVALGRGATNAVLCARLNELGQVLLQLAEFHEFCLHGVEVSLGDHTGLVARELGVR